MRVTWIGQAGLIFKTSALTVLMDPYLSDSVAALEPAKARRVPVDPSVFTLQPDVLIFTHDHLDHYDPETAEHWLRADHPMTVLAPDSVWQKVRKFGGCHNYVRVSPGTQWTEGGVRFTAVKAEHSDPAAIGVLLRAEGRTYYVTGDTLYSSAVLETLPKDIDTVFLPVNGVGNNMNMVDAARFAHDCGAKQAVPVHVGLFDTLDPQAFPFENKRILPVYQEVTL